MTLPVVHATHWKAGSQWIYKVLADLTPERITYNDFSCSMLTPAHAKRGAVFSPVYLTADELAARLPGIECRRFFVVRDLRDALVSLYYHVMYSYRPSGSAVDDMIMPCRRRLAEMTQEEGLLMLIDEALPYFSRVQAGWLDVDALVVRFEDLVEQPDETFGRLFEYCGFEVSPASRAKLVERHSFRSLTGRARGDEDVKSHFRKGVAGDWRRHFTSKVTERFRNRFGSHLVATGYERDLDWVGTALQPVT